VSLTKKEFALIDFERRHLESVVRTSVHYYHTEAEIARFCKEIEILSIK
jgi:selenocysteine lyase/cysteine desulfurase